MKKIFFTLVLSVTFINGFTQGFPGNNPEFLLNKIVKPKIVPDNPKFHSFAKNYKNFYPKTNKPFPFQVTSNDVTSDYTKLVGKEFIVLAVYEAFSRFPEKGKLYALELDSKELGKIYYSYNPKYDFDFELEVVGGLDYPQDFFCSKITEQKDKFEDKTTYFTPYENGISFMKTIENGKSALYLGVDVNGSTLNVSQKGLNILFEDGTKFTKPEAKIDTKVASGSGYLYSAFVKLTPAEIKILTEKNITDTRVYIYDGTVDNDSAIRIREYLKCLSK
jgi:hypothetical protein